MTDFYFAVRMILFCKRWCRHVDFNTICKNETAMLLYVPLMVCLSWCSFSLSLSLAHSLIRSLAQLTRSNDINCDLRLLLTVDISSVFASRNLRKCCLRSSRGGRRLGSVWIACSAIGAYQQLIFFLEASIQKHRSHARMEFMELRWSQRFEVWECTLFRY